MRYSYYIGLYKKAFSFRIKNFQEIENTRICDLIYIYSFFYFFVLFAVKLLFFYLLNKNVSNIVFYLFLDNMRSSIINFFIACVSFYMLAFFMCIPVKIGTLVKCFLSTGCSYTFIATVLSFVSSELMHYSWFMIIGNKVYSILVLGIAVLRFFSIRNYFIASVHDIPRRKITAFVLLSFSISFVLLVIVSFVIIFV